MSEPAFNTPRFPTDALPRLPFEASAKGALQNLLEAQRQTLAREVHDDIGGALTSLHFDLAWLARHPGSAEAPERLRSAQEAVRQAIEATQRVVHALYPPDLDDGLDVAVRGLAERFERRTGIATALEGSSDGTALSPELALAAYRTVQEALSNVARHAQCRQVCISLDVSSGLLRAAVRDDGRGMDGETDEDRGAFGLRGLAERARSVGGHLQVDSEPGQGTTVTFAVTLSAEAREPASA